VGAFEGILTIEDVIEEVVGKIQDEFDVERRWSPRSRNSPTAATRWTVASALDAVNETLGTAFESDAFDTIGGFRVERLGRRPRSTTRYRLTATR